MCHTCVHPASRHRYSTSTWYFHIKRKVVSSSKPYMYTYTLEVPEVPVKVELRVVESVKSNSRITCFVLYIYKLQFTTRSTNFYYSFKIILRLSLPRPFFPFHVLPFFSQSHRFLKQVEPLFSHVVWRDRLLYPIHEITGGL